MRSASLADAGADLNLGDPDGITPMVLAIRNGHYDVAAALVEKGANVNAADAAGRTPLYMSVDMHSLDWIQNRPAPSRRDARQPRRRGCCSRKGANADAQLKAAPPGWKGDAVAAQNTFGGVVGPGQRRSSAPRRTPTRLRCACCSRRAPIRTSQRADTTALMALVGGLGRKYGADLQVSPAEEKNAMQGVAAAGSRRRRQRRQRSRTDARCTPRRWSAPTASSGSWWSAAPSWTRRHARGGRRATRRCAAWPTSTERRRRALDTAALLQELMEQRGLDVKPAASGPAAPPAEP